MNLSQRFDLVWPTLKTLGGEDEASGGMEKLLAMAVLGGGSFLAGMLPAFISDRSRQRFPLLISCLLCFGAGILLATSLVHILPEIRAQINSSWAEITMCAGFFLMYFVDEIIHYFFSEGAEHSHTPQSGQNRRSYGSVQASEPLLNEHREPDAEHSTTAHETSGHSHASHSRRCSLTVTGTLGLFVALSLHSAIEGLAIGVQNSRTKVLFLLGAVACHKFVMGFCLGLEFRTGPLTSLKAHITGVGVFSCGAIIGIGLGMLLTDIPASWSATALPIIQGIAGGTLFYVTACEVIPREKAKWHQNMARKSAGLAQFLAVVLGFAAMTAINFYADDDA